MAQNSSGTANSVNPQSGSPTASGSNGSAKLLGGGQISAEGSCTTQAPSEQHQGASFATQTIEQSSSA